ncbi:helix-turn-helix domain-containing protein [Aquabacterium sp. A7-Y]|uniref:helix-turn-helix domain-containing protein n=1 Tax=Aquabacterium sp. A7-Y TaxID=1349605 RepID=UPI00223CA00C|nr:helix-turn-helix domain-containing protein [Aquabacterium sp. A7-Y]MCW7538817.1 helix-turn-helix domain-containing protein [Aquabacterium sp. A7-Y]
MPERPPAPPSARRIAPRASLADCVRAYITRDTTGVSPLTEAQRLNRYPATVHATLTWFIEGAAESVDAPGNRQARVLFSGPQDRPYLTRNPGPVRVFIAMFFPQALHALTGVDMSLQVNRHVPATAVLGGPWLDLTRQVLAAPDDTTRIALVEDFLEPRWRAARRDGPEGPATDWAQALDAFAAAAGWRSSARTLERRVKVWAGQPVRSLRRLSRVEETFFDLRKAASGAPANWADMAAHAGYADQPHFCRETRRITGHSPGELALRVLDDESYWLYRVWSGAKAPVA